MESSAGSSLAGAVKDATKMFQIGRILLFFDALLLFSFLDQYRTMRAFFVAGKGSMRLCRSAPRLLSVGTRLVFSYGKCTETVGSRIH